MSTALVKRRPLARDSSKEFQFHLTPVKDRKSYFTYANGEDIVDRKLRGLEERVDKEKNEAACSQMDYGLLLDRRR